jgi:hypothetical protein
MRLRRKVSLSRQEGRGLLHLGNLKPCTQIKAYPLPLSHLRNFQNTMSGRQQQLPRWQAEIRP